MADNDTPLNERVLAIWKLYDQGQAKVPGDEILQRIQDLLNSHGNEGSSSSSSGFNLKDFINLLRIVQLVSHWKKRNSDKAKETVLRIIEVIRKQGITELSMVYQLAIDSLIKCGKPLAAISLWQEMKGQGNDPDIVGFGIILNAYCKAIKAGLSRTEATTRAWELLDQVKEAGLRPEQQFLSVLLNVMLEANDRQGFMRALRIVPEFDYHFHEEVAMDIILRAAIQFQDPMLGFEMFGQAKKMGYRPTVVALDRLLRLCDVLEEQRIRASNDVWRILFFTMIDSNERHRFFDVERVFWRMRNRPDTPIWNALIEGYGEFSSLEKVLSLLREMKQEGAMPNANTLGIVLRICYRHRDLATALQVFHSLKSDGVEIDSKHFETLLELAVSRRDSAHFDEILRLIEQSDLHSGLSLKETIIWGNGKFKRFKAAMALFEETVKSSETLDVIFFNSVLEVCKMANDLTRANEIFARMTQLGICPNNKTCQIILDIMVLTGLEDEECEEFKSRMQKEFKITFEDVPDATTDGPEPSEAASIQLSDDE